MKVDPLRRGGGILFALAVLILAACSTKPDEPGEIRTRRRQADSLMEQGHARTDALEFAVARSSYEAALDIYGALDDRSGAVSALLALGRNSRQTGDDAAAEELYLHARAMAEAAGDMRALQDALNHQADMALRKGDPVSAADLLADPAGPGGDSSPRVTEGRERSAQLRLLGSARYALGEEEEAVSLLIAAAAVARDSQEPTEAAQAYYKLASIASLAARFDEAAAWALQALDADKEAEYGPGIAADLRALAIISAKAGDDMAAEDYYRRAWLAWRGLGRDLDAAEARAALENLTGRPITVL